jgi:hypothetical protein
MFANMHLTQGRLLGSRSLAVGSHENCRRDVGAKQRGQGPLPTWRSHLAATGQGLPRLPCRPPAAAQSDVSDVVFARCDEA